MLKKFLQYTVPLIKNDSIKSIELSDIKPTVSTDIQSIESTDAKQPISKDKKLLHKPDDINKQRAISVDPTFAFKPEILPLHYVLDIDQTIALRLFPEEVKKIEHTFHWRWFKENGLIFEFESKDEALNTTVNCLVLPGVIELLQYIFKVPQENKLTFYSAGVASFNKPVVETLLRRALGEEHYLAIKDQYTLLSRNDCIIQGQQMKKDISKCMSEEDKRPTILIDDDKSVICQGQENQMLWTRGLKLKQFIDPHGKDVFRWNHIFGIVGLLTEASRAGKENFLDRLFELQKEKKSSHYELGLQELRKINPEISFFSNHFHELIKFGLKDSVESLLNENEKYLETLDEKQNTPLLTAVRLEKVDIIRLLLERKANINAKNSGSWTAISYSWATKNIEITRMLVHKGAMLDIRYAGNISYLLLAINNQEDDLLYTIFPAIDVVDRRNYFLLIISHLMNTTLTKATDVVLACKNIQSNGAHFPLFDPFKDSIYKISQLRILDITYQQNQTDKIVEEELKVENFMRSRESMLSYFLTNTKTTFFVYKQIQKDKKSAEKLYLEKKQELETDIGDKLFEVTTLPPVGFKCRPHK